MADTQTEPALTGLVGLLDEFRNRRIVVRPAEEQALRLHTGPLSARWNTRFPGFPAHDFAYTSIRGHYYRGRRDAHLKNIIVQLLGDCADGKAIVNAACVFGRHACHLAGRLPRAQVVATDIDPRCYRMYRTAKLGRLPRNFRFVRDDIFEPQVDVNPTAVVFFGACGAVSDGAIDYAIASGAKYVVCRTCCHENIAGNVRITPRPNPVNRFFRFKNRVYGHIGKTPKYTGFFFSPKYMPAAYPRSAAAKQLSTADEFLALARDSVDSDICRAIIDLDRCLHLAEHGFRVEYQGELFVAEREA